MIDLHAEVETGLCLKTLWGYLKVIDRYGENELTRKRLV